ASNGCRKDQARWLQHVLFARVFTSATFSRRTLLAALTIIFLPRFRSGGPLQSVENFPCRRACALVTLSESTQAVCDIPLSLLTSQQHCGRGLPPHGRSWMMRAPWTLLP